MQKTAIKHCQQNCHFPLQGDSPSLQSSKEHNATRDIVPREKITSNKVMLVTKITKGQNCQGIKIQRENIAQGQNYEGTKSQRDKIMKRQNHKETKLCTDNICKGQNYEETKVQWKNYNETKFCLFAILFLCNFFTL